MQDTLWLYRQESHGHTVFYCMDSYSTDSLSICDVVYLTQAAFDNGPTEVTPKLGCWMRVEVLTQTTWHPSWHHSIHWPLKKPAWPQEKLLLPLNLSNGNKADGGCDNTYHWLPIHWIWAWKVGTNPLLQALFTSVFVVAKDMWDCTAVWFVWSTFVTIWVHLSLSRLTLPTSSHWIEGHSLPSLLL